MKTIDISDFPVMAGRCPTCPFHEQNEGQREIANMVRERCVTAASQICHHPRLHGKEETHLCRGARDFQLQIFHRLGVIDEPTDQAWDRAKPVDVLQRRGDDCGRI
ncbi:MULTISPECIES: hypothetical protein [Methylomonas]|uniref:hypothetical protein n=1 Tax=Methylomonas TaxID=416 RepID=UPI0012F67FE5|nr:MULTISPECIES: hypothetical protein [Methylomonas]